MRCATAFLAASAIALAVSSAAREAGAQAVAPRIVRVSGRVEYSAPDARTFGPAQADTTLTRGARLRTGEDGTAEIAWADGVLLTMEAASLLTLFGTGAAAVPGVPPATTTTLHRGIVRFAVEPGRAVDDAPPLGTAALTVFPGRADATVAAELAGHITRVGVTRGRMRVRFGTVEYIVPAQNAVREEVRRPPAIMGFLPRPPEWRRRPSTHAVSFGEPVDVDGTFAPNHRPPGLFPVTGWRVEVARDEGFHARVSEQRLAAHETRLRIPGLAPGTWFVRLFAVDSEHFESSPSPVARVEIAAPRVDPAVLPTASRPGRRAALVVPPRFFCSLDGAPFVNEGRPVLLDPARRYALRCGTSADGHDARATTIEGDRVGPFVHAVRLGAPVATTGNPVVSAPLALDLHDAEGRPVSLASVDVTADGGAAADAPREAESRGTYVTALRVPRAVREVHVRFTINHAVSVEETVEIPAVADAPMVPVAHAPAPAAVQVQVIRAAQPFRHPEDEEERNDEEP